jgi:ABC-2 type transport system ATP-binding protein
VNPVDGAVRARSLTKVYPGAPPIRAVDAIDLEVAEGEIFGLLGPNGAGKTTTVGMCTTRVVPTAGRVEVAGADVARQPPLVRRRIGVVTQFNTLDRSCTVAENLLYHCRYFGLRAADARARTAELLDRFRLADRARAMPDELSGGMAQRLQVARAIAHRPAVLFLDEPTAGLDPQSRIALWDVLGELHADGTTIVLTTHYMEEADRLCQRVAIIDHGRILVCDTPAALKRSVEAESVYDLRLDGDPGAVLADLAALPGVVRAERQEGGVRLFAQGGDGLLPRVVQAASSAGVSDLSVDEPTLETVFITLTGRALRD